MPLSGKPLTWAITTVCGTSFALFGYDQGLMAGIIGQATNEFGKDFSAPDAALQGAILGTYSLGALLAALIFFQWGDIMGRRQWIFLGVGITWIGVIIQCASIHSVGQFITGRVVTGVGVGSLTASIPVWQSETSHERHRGKLFAIDTVISVGGVVIAYWLNYGMTTVTGPAQWRLPVAFQLVFATFVAALTVFLPESPRYLQAKGREAESIAVLARLAGRNVSVDDAVVRKRHEDIVHAIELENKDGPFKIKEIFQMGKTQNFRRIMLCLAVDSMTQLSGINFITYYAPNLYESIGMDRHTSVLVGGFQALEYFLIGWVPVFLIERVGRRKMMIGGSAGCCIMMGLASILINNGGKAASIAAVACIYGFNSCFAFAWLTVPWLYGTEVTTLRIRAKGASVASGAYWIWNFVIVMITPSAVQNLGYKTYIIFCVLCFFFIPVIYLFFPETSNMSLEDVDFLFEKGGITGGVWAYTRGRGQIRHMSEVFAEQNEGERGSEKSSPPSEKGGVVQHVEV